MGNILAFLNTKTATENISRILFFLPSFFWFLTLLPHVLESYLGDPSRPFRRWPSLLWSLGPTGGPGRLSFRLAVGTFFASASARVDCLLSSSLLVGAHLWIPLHWLFRTRIRSCRIHVKLVPSSMPRVVGLVSLCHQLALFFLLLTWGSHFDTQVHTLFHH